jgi:tetrahydromethanopterin S-methyltransferase subunit G
VILVRFLNIRDNVINQINSNDDDLLGLKGRLDNEEPKIVSLQSLTAIHSGQIISNYDDITELQDRLDTEETKIVALKTLTQSHVN